jgi:hypothetical protein
VNRQRRCDPAATRQSSGTRCQVSANPVVHPMLAEIFGHDLPPEPDHVVDSLVHVWMGR